MRQSIPEVDLVILPSDLKERLKELEHTTVDGVQKVGPIICVLVVAYRGKRHRLFMELFLRSDGFFDITLGKVKGKNEEVIDALTELLQTEAKELSVFLLENINEDLPLYSKYRRWYGLKADTFSLLSDKTRRYAIRSFMTDTL